MPLNTPPNTPRNTPAIPRETPSGSALVWFRRDLRNFDHTALQHALRRSARVYCAFIYDKEILTGLVMHDAARQRTLARYAVVKKP